MLKSLRSFVLLFVITTFAAGGCASSRSQSPQTLPPEFDPGHLDSRYNPIVGTKGMVVADDRQAAEWGADVLRQGGNAIDAAVATAFAMAVTRPHFASLGGGGFMVYCPAPTRQGKQPCQSLDYREEAPGAATRDMFIRNGKGDTDLSQNGALASGVPGVTAGLLAALEKYGTMSRQKLLKKPIEIAHQGFLWSGHEEVAALERWDHFNAESKRLFGCGEKKDAPCAPGTRIRQPELAQVLEAISRNGARGFYEGWVAQKLTAGLRAAGGIMTADDLKAYHPHWRKPVQADYRGMEVVSMPPPSAGGTVLLEMLGFMERADRQGQLAEGYGSAKTLHAIASGMALAFADRAKHFGDPDHVHVPVDEMLSKAYLDERWSSFNPSKFISPSDAGKIRGLSTDVTRDPHMPALQTTEGQHTTHFSVIDRFGNAVAITTTVNDNFGSGFTPPGVGVVMNNEMDDFSVQPGVPNLFGLVGAEANAIAPHKRPLSSMSPTVVRDAEGNARIVIGAAGGPTITTSVFLGILNRLRFGMSLVDAVAAARVHQQWKPEELKLESHGFPADTRRKLLDLGYKLGERASIAKVHALERFPNGRVWGAPDFRAEGAAVAE